MRSRLSSLIRRVLQLIIAFLILLSLGGLLLFTIYSFFPSISIPYLSPAQKVTRDTVFYHRSWREPFEYDIKVYASQSKRITVDNAASFFESAKLLWHVQQQSLEKKHPEYSTKVNFKLPESMLNETIWSSRSMYAHVFIQRSDQFTPHPNISDPYLVYTSTDLVSTTVSPTHYTQPHSMLNGTSHSPGRKRTTMHRSPLAWDLVLEDHTYTNETLPKVLRQSVSDYPDEESKTGTYNPPLIYRRTKGRWTINTVPVESMPRPANSNGQSSSSANTARIASVDVELKIQGISQGWVRGEDAIMKLAEPKVERKTMTITRRPHHHQSESNVAHGSIHDGRVGPARPTATASSGNIGSTHLSNSELGEHGGYKSETLVSAPENIREVVYTMYTTSMQNNNFDNAIVFSVLLVLSMPLAVALLLTAFSDVIAFWSREDTKWEGTSRLAVVLEVVYQCGFLVLMCMGYTVYSRRNILAYFPAGLSIWVFAALYNVPVNPLKWWQRISSLRAPASSEMPKPVLAGNDDGSSTTKRVSEPPRMRASDLAASIQQEADQRLKIVVLTSLITLLFLDLVYTAATSRTYSFNARLIVAVNNILGMIRMFQLVPQVIINYRTKSVAWIPITAYMCELLVNIHQMLVEWAFGWPVFFSPVPAGINQIYCLLLAVFAVQWVKYYKAKQD
ncbi:hypothetical protein GQ54DRAFT_300850 [Martensiomyces pterosporus]|nr:hypothetical protein GQ54DRAFT_300850 [Martensiomyces pterosporus]